MSKVVISVCIDEDFLKELDLVRGREQRSSYVRYLIGVGYGVDRVMRSRGIPPEELATFLRDQAGGSGLRPVLGRGPGPREARKPPQKEDG